ncbi:glycosyltransferase [Galbitalea soli]|nr:glycosyltransferase [Galbitalea soli]NYJ30687.1 glycosyltransferase involved in cell wall biosynthesis [Galbitalea soli]
MLRIAMLGTRGVPAAYGGFETAIEEIGQRLAARGHEVTVYCRSADGSKPRHHLGMRLVHLPALRSKSLETLSHTALSAAHAVFHRRPDVSFVFNAANSPFLPLIRTRRAPVAVHVDGLEWKRGKWGTWGKRYYRLAEQLAVRWSDALISDAQGIADYYTLEFGIASELISYGTNIIREPARDKLAGLGLEAGRYHLVVARFEPENHVDVVVQGYAASHATLPLVVVGSAPYSAAYTDSIAAVAESDPRITMLGGVWDQDLLDQLYANAALYLHGHSVGGTNPSLLRAMGAGTAVAAYDVSFNREVLGEDGRFFSTVADVAERVHEVEAADEESRVLGHRLQGRAEQIYNWDVVTDGYEELARRLHRGYSTRGRRRGSRAASTWIDETAPRRENEDARS